MERNVRCLFLYFNDVKTCVQKQHIVNILTSLFYHKYTRILLITEFGSVTVTDILSEKEL